MTVLKNGDNEIKSFKFNSFNQSSNDNIEAKKFNFKEIDPNSIPSKAIDEKKVRLERELASKGNFKIDLNVQHSRGLKNQENNDFNIKLNESMQAKYNEIYEEAYSKGFNQGELDGKAEALMNSAARFDEELQKISSFLIEIENLKSQILIDHKSELYSIIKNISKWVSLKEVKEDESGYLEALLVKLINEINLKNSLTIKVSQDTYNLMPEVLDKLESRIADIGNIKCEVSPEIRGEGLIIESANGIIDASLDAQFKMIDNLFSKAE